MSYVSLLKSIPEFLSQPAGIAAIASVGIHGAIAFIMPLMPVESKSKQASSPKTVGLVELSQAEQNRLPQTGATNLALQPQTLQPQPALPNFATQPTPLPPPLPPLNSTQLTLEPLPKSPNNFSTSSVPKGQSLRIISRKDLQIVPSFSPKKSFPEEEKGKFAASKPLASSNVPYNVPGVQPGKIPEDLLNTSPPPLTDTTSATAEGITTPQTTEPFESSTVVPPVERLEAGDNTIASSGQNRLQQSPPKISELPSTATSVEIAKITTIGDQFAKVKEQYPNIETKLPVSGTINAQAELEGKVEGALVVDPEGKVESIDFISSSVSSNTKIAVNQHFREYLQNNPPQANGKPKYYPFSLSLRPNSRNPETAPELAPFSPKNQTQVSSDAQRSLLQRLRSPQVNLQPSKEPQASISRDVISPLVNPQPSKPQGNLSEQGLRSPLVNPQSSKKPLRLPQVNPQSPKEQLQTLSEQGLRSSVVNLKPSQSNQTASLPQVNQQQTPRLQVIVKQPVAASQANQQQISRVQVIVKQPVAAPQANQQQTPQQLVSSNQSSTLVDSSQKLLRQLRQHREKRQSSNQEQ